MASPKSSTSYAILGLLSVRPWTTYELAQQVRRSLNWFWPRAERKLYDEPKRLVEAGLATASAEHTGRRPRTVYAITSEGRAALRRWLGEPAAARTSEFEGMVKVFFADGGSLEQLKQNLARIEQEAQGRLDDLARMAARPSRFPEREHLSALCLPLQLEQESAVVRWAGWARAQVEHWVATDDPGSWDADEVRSRLGHRPAATTWVGP
jgi:PadR family transcriptional regulator, regulatory protein AphA